MEQKGVLIEAKCPAIDAKMAGGVGLAIQRHAPGTHWHVSRQGRQKCRTRLCVREALADHSCNRTFIGIVAFHIDHALWAKAAGPNLIGRPLIDVQPLLPRGGCDGRNVECVGQTGRIGQGNAGGKIGLRRCAGLHRRFQRLSEQCPWRCRP